MTHRPDESVSSVCVPGSKGLMGTPAGSTTQEAPLQSHLRPPEALPGVFYSSAQAARVNELTKWQLNRIPGGCEVAQWRDSRWSEG